MLQPENREINWDDVLANSKILVWRPPTAPEIDLINRTFSLKEPGVLKSLEEGSTNWLLFPAIPYEKFMYLTETASQRKELFDFFSKIGEKQLSNLIFTRTKDSKGNYTGFMTATLKDSATSVATLDWPNAFGFDDGFRELLELPSVHFVNMKFSSVNAVVGSLAPHIFQEKQDAGIPIGTTSVEFIAGGKLIWRRPIGFAGQLESGGTYTRDGNKIVVSYTENPYGPKTRIFELSFDEKTLTPDASVKDLAPMERIK